MTRLRSGDGPHNAWWTAEYDENTGQAIVTARVVAILAEAGGRGVTYRAGGILSSPSWMKAIFRLWFAAASGSVRQVYLVCSRSNAGFLRDLPAYLLLLFGIRVVVHTHGSDIVDLCRRPWIGGVARFFLSRCVLVLPSAHLAGPLDRLGIRDTVCCENFFEPSDAVGAGERHAGMAVLWNSNIMASKGFFVVAVAVGLLARAGTNLRLIALGRCIGDEAMSLTECAAALESLRSEAWFEHRGQVSRIESARLLGEADAVCLPSTYSSECQPLALIEAMCAARPIIIADTPALRHTVRDYPCEIVDLPPTPESVADALSRVKASPALEQAAQQARQRFSPQRFDREMRVLLRLQESSNEGFR